jgi:hypothetical protein
VQAVAAALEHMEATASALFVGKILKEETALKLEAGTKRIQAPPCVRDYFNQCCGGALAVAGARAAAGAGGAVIKLPPFGSGSLLFYHKDVRKYRYSS